MAEEVGASSVEGQLPSTTLRQRGGGAVEHGSVTEVVADPLSKAPVLSTSSDWVTSMMTKPAGSGSKRSRKGPASRPRGPPPMVTAEADTTSFGFSQLAPVSAFSQLTLPSAASRSPMPMPPFPMETSEMEAALSEPDGMALESALESALGLDGDLVDLLPDGSGPRSGPVETHKKARHNLTERARVDRLNKLFFKLSVALDDPDPAAPDVALNDRADDFSGPSARKGLKGERSKAEVIEGALSLITTLRGKIAQYEEQAKAEAGSTTTDTASAKSEMSDVTDLD